MMPKPRYISLDSANNIFLILKFRHAQENRRHAYELHKEGVDYFKRETFNSALNMARDVIVALGYNHESMQRKTKLDETSLQHSFEFFEKEPELISFSRQVAGELERILQSDQQTGSAGNI